MRLVWNERVVLLKLPEADLVMGRDVVECLVLWVFDDDNNTNWSQDDIGQSVKIVRHFVENMEGLEVS